MIKTDLNRLQAGSDEKLGELLKKLLFYSLLIITVPVGLYFATKMYVFEGYYKLSSTDSYFYAAIVAIVAVHVLLSMFIYVAWNEGSKASVATYKSD